MTHTIDATHDPSRTSWVTSAQAVGTDFPIQNLPFGVFKRREGDAEPRVGVAIGDQILDISACLAVDLFDGFGDVAAQACRAASLNGLMSVGQPYWTEFRAQLSAILTAVPVEHDPRIGHHLLVPMAEAELMLPAVIGDYTDFYASVYHATNVGSMFRPDNPLLPNYKHVPIGYHGRASSIVVSGSPIRRPFGQTKGPQDSDPSFGPAKQLDYEMEVGWFIGPGNYLGVPIPVAEAEEHLFGFCLVNDWSARDVQAWEYQPLGPFLAKSFATTVSPWVVTLDALAPFRCPTVARPADDPQPLPYLVLPEAALGAIDLTLVVELRTAAMRQAAMEPQQLSQSSFVDMYWTPTQMLTHHASNGCNLRPGDLLASGTVSGPTKAARGCLLELTWRGSEPLTLPSGETRRFLEDGDEVIMHGRCQREGYVGIGFGECRGTVVSAQ